jgi:maleate cis-trans isomerase
MHQANQQGSSAARTSLGVITPHAAAGPEAEWSLMGAGNGFRVAPALEQLEQQRGRPVIASNQVLLWSLLGKAGAGPEVSGYGSLFRQPPAAC